MLIITKKFNVILQEIPWHRKDNTVCADDSIQSEALSLFCPFYFSKLCLGTYGFGYKGSKIFRALPNNHIFGGDFEHNNGSGGYCAVPDAKLFLAEQCPLGDEKGSVSYRPFL